MIESTADLISLVEALRDAEILGLDVEGDSFFRYHGRMCTLQIGDAEEVEVVDTLALEDLSPLAALLGPDGPTKVVHDVSFDRKMLATRGVTLANVFDTAIAARFLGHESTGLASLLEARFGVTLDKDHQLADWGARPLDEDQLDYLVADVRHLPALAAQLREEAREADILEEIAEETEYALERALDPEPVREPWTRIKGARDLKGGALAMLAALADARERVAEERDVPPFRVAPNRALHEAARRKPKKPKHLRKVRGLRKLPDAALREALEAAERDGPPDLGPAEPPPPPEVRNARKAREKALSKWRKAEAAEREVDLQVVLPGHCLRDLAELDDPSERALDEVAGLGDKRRARYGEAILRALRDADPSG